LPSQAATRRRGLFLVLAATFLWSLAGLFARLIPHLDFGTVLFFRGLFGGACGLALAYLEWRLGRLDARRLLSPLAPLVVGLAAFAISAYVAALMATTVADVLVIYATLPFFAAGMAFALTGERASRRTLIAASLAMVGIVVMAAGGLGHGRLLGQSLALAMTVTFALLVVLQRRDPTLPVAPINSLAALVAAASDIRSRPTRPSAPSTSGCCSSSAPPRSRWLSPCSWKAPNTYRRPKRRWSRCSTS